MSHESALPWMLSVALLTVRLAVALALTPPLASFGTPAVVRMSIATALAALTFAQRAPAELATAASDNPAALPAAIAAEVFIGALLGLGVQLLFAALALAGRLMDVQVGIALGSIFDPVSRTQSNVLGTLTGLVGAALFFISDAHLQLAHLAARSLDVLPLGVVPSLDEPMQPLLAAGSMFTFGFALAAPVVMALLLTDAAIGVASRNMPQINVLVLAMPIKVIVGYFVLALAVVGWGPLLQRGFTCLSPLSGAC